MHLHVVGPELPSPLEAHKLVEVTDGLTLVIGGSNNGIHKSSTHYYDHDKGKWSDGPILLFKRRDHAVGVITDETTLKKLIAVTGGSQFAPKSIEILLDKKWLKGRIVKYIFVIKQSYTQSFRKISVLCIFFHVSFQYYRFKGTSKNYGGKRR